MERHNFEVEVVGREVTIKVYETLGRNELLRLKKAIDAAYKEIDL